MHNLLDFMDLLDFLDLLDLLDKRKHKCYVAVLMVYGVTTCCLESSEDSGDDANAAKSR